MHYFINVMKIFFRCDEGYFGNPLEIGSTCKPCDCGGNPCNPTTGRCLKCEGNTEGWYCEQCKDGFYGKAAEKNCSSKYNHLAFCDEKVNFKNYVDYFSIGCDCNIFGSENGTSCDVHSGQCMCKMNYIGRKCDKCLVSGSLKKLFIIS